MKNKSLYTLGELAALLDTEILGSADIEISGLATLKNAGPGQLTFLSNPRYVSQLAGSQASAVIIHADQAEVSPCACLLTANPYVTYALASQLFISEDAPAPGIHSSAVISGSASIGDGSSIAALAVIEEGAKIGTGTVVGAGCYIGRNASIGDNCRVYANVSIYHDVSIADNCIIHSGAVIGADGFGFAFDGKKSVKIAQLGSVRIANDVEIGAGTTIDRGAIDDTVIEQGVKLDNQVQIGHNCVVGRHTVICGCSAVAGSTSIGSYCIIGGGVGIIGHLQIADKVSVSAMSLVTRSISAPGTYSSGTGLMESQEWKRNIVRFSQLDDMSKRLRELEKKS